MSADEYSDHHGTRPPPSDRPAEDDQGPGEGRARPLVPGTAEAPGATIPAPAEEGGGAAAPAPTAKPQSDLETQPTGQGEQTLVPGVAPVSDVESAEAKGKRKLREAREAA